MAKTYTSALASLGFALLSSAALAAGDNLSGMTVDQLPKEGRATLTGTVDSVKGNQEFVLRDRNGNTINVDSERAVNLVEGSQVRVSGNVDSKFMGMGKELNSASVVVMDTASQGAQSGMNQTNAGQSMTNQQANRNATLQNSNTNRDNGMYNGNNLNSAADGLQRGENNATNTATTRYGAGNAQQSQAGQQQRTTIQRLPDDGKVTITGEVASVNRDDMSFTLRDNNGETIDVHTDQRLTIRTGDQVRVSGNMDDEIAGMGEEITSAEVQLIKR